MLTPVACRRLLFALLAAILATLGQLSASAQADNALVGLSGMEGIQLNTWAVGDIEAVTDDQGLRLSRLHFDSCTGITLHNTGGSTLIYAESQGVQYAYQGGESYPNDVLAQGDSIAVDPTGFLTIINPNSDPANAVDLLILSVTEGDSFVDVPVIENFEFPDDSFCDGISDHGTVTPTILGEGVVSEGGDSLYIGSAFFYPGSTTEGWEIAQEGTSFNFLIQAGSMNTAGPNSGRAAWIGPGQVNKSYYNLGPVDSYAFVNDGNTPVFGLVFGTVPSGDVVWSPAE